MSEPGFFQSALIYLTAAVISVPIAKRLGLGSVLGYLAAGVGIGPHILGLVGDSSSSSEVMHIAESGVVVMLFLIGLELKLPSLWRMRGTLIGLGGSQMLVCGVTLGLGVWLWGLEFKPALLTGFILALSSTAIVLQTLREKSLHTTAGGRHAFATLLFQDIAVIPLLAVLPLLAAPSSVALNNAHSASPFSGMSQAFAILAAIGTVILVGRWLLPFLFSYIANAGLREIFTATALLLVLAIGGLMSLVGLSPALGAFVAGVVLASSPYRHELEGDLEPFKGLLLGLFFISVGASIDLDLILSNPIEIALLLVGFVVVKGTVLASLARLFKFAPGATPLYALSMFQGGEFAFVLFSQATNLGILATDQAARFNAIVALSMALTPLALLAGRKWLKSSLAADKSNNNREADAIEHSSPVILAGFGRFGNFVGRLLKSQGFRPVVLETDAEHVDLTRRLGFEVHYGDATRLDILHAAGAEHAKLLIIALGDEEAIDLLVATARRHFPGLEIIARAISMDHRLRLIQQGVQHVFHELAGSALDAGAQTLRLLGVPAYPAERATRKFRRWDLESARHLAPIRQKDESTYFAMVRERVANLETLFRADPTLAGSQEAKAWRPPGAPETPSSES
jgi:monovalent cation:proton antiporter-2 (CPA2) family protein